MKFRWDENLGFMAGIVAVVIIGKCYLATDMGIGEIVGALLKGLIGW